MLELESVTIKRNGRTLIEDVDLRLEAGKLTAILGPNGAGKSTVLKALTGEWAPTRGRVLLDGEDLRQISAERLAQRRAVVPQATALSFPFTVLGVVTLGMTVPGFGFDSDPGPALDAIADVDLEGYEQRIYAQLSGGERQRVHVARALCQLNASPSPIVHSLALLLDEPTASLDPAHQALLLELLQRKTADGWAIVVVLHDLNLAAAWADDVILMAGGRVTARGSPSEVFTDAILSSVYGCSIRANTIPADSGVFVLPHHIALPDAHGGRTGRASPTRSITSQSKPEPPNGSQAKRTCD